MTEEDRIGRDCPSCYHRLIGCYPVDTVGGPDDISSVFLRPHSSRSYLGSRLQSTRSRCPPSDTTPFTTIRVTSPYTCRRVHYLNVSWFMCHVCTCVCVCPRGTHTSVSIPLDVFYPANLIIVIGPTHRVTSKYSTVTVPFDPLAMYPKET